MTIDCGEVRRRLRPAAPESVSDRELEAAIEHAENCSACRVFLEQDRRVAELIRAAIPHVRAPRHLREQLHTLLARQGEDRRGNLALAGSFRRLVSIGAAGAASLIIGFAVYRLARQAGDDSLAMAFAEDYLHRLAEQKEPRLAERREIAALFARELSLTMPAPEIADFELQRAAICSVNSRRGGVVEYRSHNQRLTYYVIPGAPLSPGGRVSAGAPRERTSIPPVPAISEERGLAVATWWDARHQHALVGNVSAHDLQRLAALWTSTVERP